MAMAAQPYSNPTNGWLCMDTFELTACFFPRNEQHDEKHDDDDVLAFKSLLDDDNDDPRNVMAIDQVLQYANIEVSLKEYEYCAERDSYELKCERIDKERNEVQPQQGRAEFEERMQLARQQHLNRYRKHQQDEQERNVAQAKEARRLASVKNAEERERRLATEEKAQAKLMGVPKETGIEQDCSQQAAKEEEEERLKEAQEEVRLQKAKEIEEARRVAEQEAEVLEARMKEEQQEYDEVRSYQLEQQRLAREAIKAKEEEMKAKEQEENDRRLRQAEQEREAEELRKMQEAEREVTRAREIALKREKEEEERAQKALEAKEEKRLARLKAIEAEERMKKARELQRKKYQMQHQDEIRRKTEEAKESRRLAIQQKMEQQKRKTEEERIRRLAKLQAESQKCRKQMENAKQQQSAWQSQQAAAAAAQQAEWQKKWTAEQQKQQQYHESSYMPRQQVPPHSSSAPPTVPLNPFSSLPNASPNGNHTRVNDTLPPGPQQQWQQNPFQAQAAGHVPSPTKQQWQMPATNSPPFQVPPQPHLHAPAHKNTTPAHQPTPHVSKTIPSANVKPADDSNGEIETLVDIKRNVLTTWALQPPTLQVLRPIQVLITSIHTVFPSNHEYFVKWSPITNVSASDDKQLKKAVRKIRVFLHPDKLPRDLAEEQVYQCKLLWDVMNDAWEEHNQAKHDLDWIK